MSTLFNTLTTAHPSFIASQQTPVVLTYVQKLHAAWAMQNSMLCVGLDPDAKRYPAHLADHPDRTYLFCQAIIDATAPYACAFKPQIAYFSAQGAEQTLERLCAYILKQYPHHVLVLDSKRGDIGDTAKQYAIESFNRYQADAVTVNPYMGFDTIQPYLAYPEKGVIVLCRTSNVGGGDFQSLSVSADEKLYERVAKLAAKPWNTSGQISLVVGATFPEELAKVRAIVGDMPLLVPGIGAQGGDIVATVAAGQAHSYGMMINSSRAIMYASSQLDFADAAANVAKQTRDAIRHATQISQPH
jgi:orotidine-5'-phosphate decarboxylase